jgi:hypothetical protein
LAMRFVISWYELFNFINEKTFAMLNPRFWRPKGTGDFGQHSLFWKDSATLIGPKLAAESEELKILFRAPKYRAAHGGRRNESRRKRNIGNINGHYDETLIWGRAEVRGFTTRSDGTRHWTWCHLLDSEIWVIESNKVVWFAYNLWNKTYWITIKIK